MNVAGGKAFSCHMPSSFATEKKIIIFSIFLSICSFLTLLLSIMNGDIL
jgi:hypothetical protein